VHDELSTSRRRPLPGQEAVSFEALMASHSAAAHKFASQAFGSATAHDICQEAWIELRHGWGTWPGKPVVWLYKLLLRHIGRWQEAQRRLAEEPALAKTISPEQGELPAQPAECEAITLAYHKRLQDPDLRRSLDESVAALRRAHYERQSGRLATMARRATRWLTVRNRRHAAAGLATWQVARMINLQAELIGLAAETLRSSRAGEQNTDVAAAERIVTDVFALAYVHQQGIGRILPTRFDAWLRAQIQIRAEMTGPRG
jgi:hypothetical protein